MKNKLTAAIASLCIVVVACKNDNLRDLYAPAKAICQTDTINTVSFKRNIQPIFGQHCALSGCHTAATKAGGLNLDSAFAFQSLQDAGSGYIDTADPSGSLIYSQMRSTSKPMPPTGNLDTCNIKLVLKWITQKAPNN